MTTIHTIVTQLTQPHEHREPYRYEGEMATWDAQHITEVPSLIDQLNNAQIVAKAGDLTGSTPSSRPAASIEAIDTLSHIDNEAAAWVRKLGHDDPGSTILCVRKVYSLAASAKFCGRAKGVVVDVEVRVNVDGKWETRKRKETICCNVHRIERDMRRWWTQARIASGWDLPAFAPNNTCPICSERRTLRIHYVDQSAFCTKCRETWSPENIGILAEHVRLENGEELVS